MTALDTTRARPRLVDATRDGIRALNETLHGAEEDERFLVTSPEGGHNIAVGISRNIDVEVVGDVGYYFGGMHQRGSLRVRGSAGVGLAENIMSGTVHITADASQSVAASGHGGLVIVDGNTGARCGISMKGVDIVVGGNIGHASAFMAQAGRLVVCGDAGESLGDSLYEAQIFVRGSVASLGADCVEKPMRAEHLAALETLLVRAGRRESAREFRRYGSARTLYHFHAHNSDAY